MKKIDNFHKAISQILVEKLTQYKGKSTTRDVCTQIYQTIFLSLQEIFTSSGVTLTNEADLPAGHVATGGDHLMVHVTQRDLPDRIGRRPDIVAARWRDTK